MFPNPADGLCADRAHGTVGAARRRRDRRLRAFLKHERVTVAMKLATIQHHSYLKSGVVNVGVQVGSPLAPVTEYVAPAQVPPVYSTTTVTTDLVHPQFSSTAVVPSAPCVVGSLPPVEEFTGPVYDQVLQVFVGMRPERLVDARKPQRCGRTVPSVGAPVLAVQSLRGFDGVDNTATKFLLQQALKKKEEEEERVKREEERVKRQEDQEEALLTRLQAERDALLVLGLGALSSQQKKRLNAVLDEREAIMDRRERRRVVAKRKRKKRRKRRTPRTSSLPGRARRRLRQWSACSAGFTGDDVPRVMFLSGVRYGPDGQLQWYGKAGFAGDSAPSAVFPSLSSGPRCSASRPVWTRRLVLLVFDDVPRAVLLLLSQAQNARHHGRHRPQDSVEVHSSWTRFSTCPLVCSEWCHGPDSAVHCLAIPQLQFITVVDSPYRCAEADPHGPDFSVDHRDSPVRIWWSMSLFAGLPQVQSWIDSRDLTVAAR